MNTNTPASTTSHNVDTAAGHLAWLSEDENRRHEEAEDLLELIEQTTAAMKSESGVAAAAGMSMMFYQGLQIGMAGGVSEELRNKAWALHENSIAAFKGLLLPKKKAKAAKK